MNPTRRILGLDYGERRIGVAVSDESGIIAMPFSVVANGGMRQAAREVSAICRAKAVGSIVIGLPLNMDGSRGFAAEAVARFTEALRGETALPVIEWDERLSSRQTERILIAGDVRRARRKELVDKIAAQLILQSYLDAHPSRGCADGPAVVEEEQNAGED